MNTPSENNKLNPQIIKDFEIGNNDLRKITIYPLTVGPQLALIKNIAEVGIGIRSAIEELEVGTVIGLIVKYLPETIEHLVDPELDTQEVLDSLTFQQLQELGELVYKTNFEPMGKKLKGLFEKAMKAMAEVEE